MEDDGAFSPLLGAAYARKLKLLASSDNGGRQKQMCISVERAHFEELAKRIAGAKLVIMEDGGHAASQTLPDEFNRHVLAFLQD